MRLTIVLLCLARIAAAEPALDLEPTHMLDGAIELRLPAGMTRMPNERDLDSRALPSWVTTRYELRLRTGAIYAVARLTFVRSDGDLKTGVDRELALQDLVGAVHLTTFDEAPGATVDPPSPGGTDATELIHAAYIVGQGRMIATVSFYVSPGVSRVDIDRYVRLARASTATVRTLGSWDHWAGASTELAGVKLELRPPLGWTVVDASGALLGYQRGTLGKPSAVCGIDDEGSRAPALRGSDPVRFLGVTATAHSWAERRLGRAEVIVRKVRAWCRVRGGSATDATRALRTLLTGVR